MNTNELICAANNINAPSLASAQEYAEKRLMLVEHMNTYMSNRPDIFVLIGGKDNVSMMEDNHTNHAKFMMALFKHYSGETLIKTVQWVLSAYPAHGFKFSYWSAQLNGWLKVLKENMSETCFNDISPIYDFLIVNMAMITDAMQEPTIS